MQWLAIIKHILCWTVFLLGALFAGFTSGLVKQVLTDFDRVVLISVFMIGMYAIVRWMAGWAIWDFSKADGAE